MFSCFFLHEGKAQAQGCLGIVFRGGKGQYHRPPWDVAAVSQACERCVVGRSLGLIDNIGGNIGLFWLILGLFIFYSGYEP